METFMAAELPEDRCRFCADESNRGEIAFAQLVQPHLLIIIRRRNRYPQEIEEPRRGNRGASTPQIDIYLFVGEIRDCLDLRTSQQMKFFIVKFGDIAGPIFDPGEKILLAHIIECVAL